MSLKIVSYKDLNRHASQFKNIKLTIPVTSPYKFVERADLIKLAAKTVHTNLEEFQKIAPEFVKCKNQYFTRRELVDLFVHIFLHYGFTDTLEEVRAVPRKKTLASLLDRTGPSASPPLNSSMKSYMAAKKEASSLLDHDNTLSPHKPETEYTKSHSICSEAT